MRSPRAFLPLCALAAACSLLVEGEPSPLPCALEGRQGPPACDEGFECRAGLCRPLEAASAGADAGSALEPDGGAGGAGAGGGGRR